jgi:hypothetical protein
MPWKEQGCYNWAGLDSPSQLLFLHLTPVPPSGLLWRLKGMEWENVNMGDHRRTLINPGEYGGVVKS